MAIKWNGEKLGPGTNLNTPPATILSAAANGNEGDSSKSVSNKMAKDEDDQVRMFRHLLAVWSSQWGRRSKSGGIQMGKRAPTGGECGIPGHFYETLPDVCELAWTGLINAQS